jgi:hypothetical protein
MWNFKKYFENSTERVLVYSFGIVGTLFLEKKLVNLLNKDFRNKLSLLALTAMGVHIAGYGTTQLLL